MHLTTYTVTWQINLIDGPVLYCVPFYQRPCCIDWQNGLTALKPRTRSDRSADERRVYADELYLTVLTTFAC